MIYQTSLTGCSYMYIGTLVMHMAVVADSDSKLLVTQRTASHLRPLRDWRLP